MSSIPDYYAILNINPSASPEEIREAYKREALRTHPDRGGNGMTRDEATRHFQIVADAYYVLSDASRRAEYDAIRLTSTNNSKRKSNADTSTANATTSSGTWNSANQAHADADSMFGDVFEELLRPEVEGRRTPWFWSPLGAASGAVLGFIVANVPGLIIGGVAGQRLGSIRDVKGTSVFEAFQKLSREQKSQILQMLAMKLLGVGLSS